MKGGYEGYAAQFRVKLKHLRKKQGLTQEKLAELAGIALQHYQDIELGRSENPGLKTLWGIAGGLKVTVAALLDVVDSKDKV